MKIRMGISENLKSNLLFDPVIILLYSDSKGTILSHRHSYTSVFTSTHSNNKGMDRRGCLLFNMWHNTHKEREREGGVREEENEKACKNGK